MIAEAIAAVVLTRGPVAESVTQRSAIISFRTLARDRGSVLLQNGDRIDADTGFSHVARLTRLTQGAALRVHGRGRLRRARYRQVPGRTGGRFQVHLCGRGRLRKRDA